MRLIFCVSHPPPPPKGDIKWFVHRWRGWPASAGRGWTLLFCVFHPPPRPPPKGDIKWFVPRWRGWPASAGRGWTCYFLFSILPLGPLRRGTPGGTALITYYLSLYFFPLAFGPVSCLLVFHSPHSPKILLYGTSRKALVPER